MTASKPRNRTQTGWPDRAIGAIAGKQLTLVTSWQLRDLRVGRGAIARAVARGRLHPRHHGVFSLVAPSALPPLAREFAAVLACGHGALLSHHSAAAVWGFRPAVRGDVHVTVVARDAGRTRPGIHAHRVDALDPRDIRTYERVPITSAARALLDTAPDLTDRDLERAFDEALMQHRTTRAAIRAVLAAYPRRRGCRRIRELLSPERKTTMTRSEGEERMFELVRNARLPQPEVNVRIGRWEVDFLWRDERVVVELDGHPYHSTRLALERNHRKDFELQRLGLFVVRISGRELRYEAEAVLVQIATSLALRRAA